jgi:glycosyltransferase involved in cell wall biosynthesis
MTGPDETVSIVITTYNHARFLNEAIASAEWQSVPATEIIVVDDGSKDDPAAVVARHPGVRLVRQAKQGLAAARNTGLRRSSSRYIAFLDADDRLLPQMLESNLRQFKACPDHAFVYGAHLLIDEAGALISKVPLRPPGKDSYKSFLAGNLVGMHGTVLYLRDLVEAEGGFDPTLPAAEDYDLLLRLARRYPVVATDEPLAEYRRHDDNMSSDIPFMLAAVLSVLRRHRAMAGTRREWKAAYRRGIKEWGDYYSGQQFVQLRKAVCGRSNVMRSVGRSLRVALLAPGALDRGLRRRILRWRRSVAANHSPRFGGLRRTDPIGTKFGYDRGKPLDRRYVERFLATYAADIRGRVLEVGDSTYTRRFGGEKVDQADVLNRFPGHPETNFVGDLAEGAGLPSDAFDCIVLTQTLHLLFDLPAAVSTLVRVLKPGGVLLVTVPWISPIDRGEWGDTWYWSVSPQALERLLHGPFAGGEVAVASYGNVLAATAFLYGLAEHELQPDELDAHDPHCPVLVAGRAVKPLGEP